MKSKQIDLSVVLPCRNEEEFIGEAIEQVQTIFKKEKIKGEIIVSDSSSDQSARISEEKGARVIKHDKAGYGNAYLEGFREAKGEVLFMADPDGSYDFKEIPRFYNQLSNGTDFMIGNRFQGTMDKGAMPWHHRYLGNPVLSALLRLFFGAKIKDVHCGMRGIKRSALKKLNLVTSGMEFASEMVVKAVQNKLIIKEVPINYHKRIGRSKLRSFVDGWRHLRFMLLYSPLFLFFIPGLALFSLGTLSMMWFFMGNPSLGALKLYYHPMFFSSLFMITGYQIMFFALFAKTYAITHLGERNSRIERMYKYITVETGGLFGLVLFAGGGAIFMKILIYWISSGYSEIQEVKMFLLALTLTVIGIQTVFSSFMLSILGIKEQ